MENTGYIAISRHATLWRQLEATANNIANVNTPAFKGERLMFREYLVDTPSSDTRFAQPISFVQDIGVLRDTEEGPMTKTDNPLDLAISGDGYFVVETPDGPRYTRNGHFRLDEAGMIVNTDGYPLMQAEGEPLIIAPNEREINVTADGAVATENGPLGKIRVVRFENEQQLRKVAGGLYDAMDAPEDVDEPHVLQGMVEESNVVAVKELTNMISILRQYEGVQKLIDNENERMTRAYDTLSQPARG